MNDAVIQTDGLTRYFGRHCALDRVSLAVPRGSVYALLGRNGSGKSTLIQVLLNLLEPTRGSATLLGEDCRRLTPKTLARVGYAPENHPLPSALRVADVHAYQKAFYTTWDDGLFATVLAHFGLQPKQKVGQLSRGQRAGLAMALVLAPRPELLILDDPSLGLDPVARRTLLEAMLLTTRQAGTTIFFTSHLLDDVERVADHVAVLDRSVLRVACRLDTLLRRLRRFAVDAADAGPLVDLPNRVQTRREAGRVIVTLANADDLDADTLAARCGSPVEELPTSLEQAVIGYLGGASEEISLLDRTAPVPALSEVA